MNSNKKIILFSLIFAGALLASCVFAVYPIFNDIGEESKELILQKGALEKLQAKTDNLREFQATYEGLKPNLDKIIGLFIDSETPIDFIKFLEKAASDSKGSLEITPGVVQKLKGDFWSSFHFQLIFSASFPNFLEFLEKLESGPYLIEITSLNIERLEEEDFRSGKFEDSSVGDINALILIKAFVK